MTKQALIIILFTGLSGILSCNSKTSTKTNLQQMTVTVETMKQVLEAFNRHDLDAIMEYFSD
ncbi:MAG: nuclear transport factor 2 family protein, partial [Ginsengibacter sp.]